MLSGASLTGQAQVRIWDNPITDGNPSSANPFTAGQTVVSNLTVSGIGRGGGLSPNAGGNRYNATAFTTSATSIDANDYFTFTLTPAANHQIHFNGLRFGYERSASGPQSFQIRTSLDNFATAVKTYTNSGTSVSTDTLSLASASYQGIATAITFRIYGYNASAASGTSSINDFRFWGNILLTPCTPSVTIQSNASNNTICPGTSVAFSVASSANLGTPSYQWKLNGNDITNATTSSYQTSALADGNQISLAVVSTAACSAGSPNATSNTITTTVNPTLVPSVAISTTSSASICQNASVSFSATPVNGGNSPSYEWFVNNVSSGSGSTFSLPTATPGTKNVFAVLTSNATCASPATAQSSTATITVNPTVVPTATLAGP